MGKCGSGNANWVCTQLFGLADLLQSGYGTCVVRISCFFELLILVKHVFSRNCYFSRVFRTQNHNQNDRMDHRKFSWCWCTMKFIIALTSQFLPKTRITNFFEIDQEWAIGIRRVFWVWDILSFDSLASFRFKLYFFNLSGNFMLDI
jgi:hypothetical protein